MNVIVWIFQNLVYRPQLNLLQFFYNFTGDIGVSIILIATVVNLLLWPLFIATYLNGQKIKILQPKLKAIQEKYKDNQQELLKHTVEFNRKHGVNNSSFLVVLIAQLFFASGLLYLTRDLSQGNISIELYETFFGTSEPSFNNTAFGFLDIGMQARNFIWLPLANLIFSYLYGLYTFKLAPKPPVTKPKKKKEGNGAFDSEAFQKSLEFQTLYVMPIFIFLFNFSFSVGVNIYFVTVSLLSLIRQIFVSRYYKDHTNKLIEDIAKTDPEFDDNLETISPGIADEPVPTKVVDVEVNEKDSKKKDSKPVKKKAKAKKAAKKKVAKTKKKNK